MAGGYAEGSQQLKKRYLRGAQARVAGRSFLSFRSAGGPQEDARDVESGQVDRGCLLVAGGDAAPLLEAVDAPLDGVALLVGLAVEAWRPAAPAASTQPVATLICRDRDCRPDAALAWLRIAREELVLSARTTSGLVRGRPRCRGTRRRPMTSVKAGASPACPAVRTNVRGRQRASAARWILVVSPPRDRPTAWSPGSPAGAPLPFSWPRNGVPGLRVRHDFDPCRS